jgi:predicted nucleic acid-binding protein
MILIDTAPLVAIVDPRDALHPTALKHLVALSPAGLWVCEAVVMEACFHLPHRMQRERLRAALGELNIDSLPTGDAGFWSDVFAWLVKYADHEPDWADACIGQRPCLLYMPRLLIGKFAANHPHARCHHHEF